MVALAALAIAKQACTGNSDDDDLDVRSLYNDVQQVQNKDRRVTVHGFKPKVLNIVLMNNLFRSYLTTNTFHNFLEKLAFKTISKHVSYIFSKSFMRSGVCIIKIYLIVKNRPRLT